MGEDDWLEETYEDRVSGGLVDDLIYESEQDRQEEG